MIKKLLFSLLFAFVCLSSFAQREINKRSQKSFTPYHNITLGVGAFPIMGGTGSLFTHQDVYYHDNYDRSRMYQNNSLNLPAFNLGYNYDLLRWLSVGGTLSYSYAGAKYYDGLSDAKIGSFSTSNLSLTAMVRFTWLRRPAVRLYSQLGIGMGLCLRHKQLFDYSHTSANETIFAGQITYFGIQAGRKVYGYAELVGFGTQGAIVVGVGYRFMDKKR